MDTYTRSFAICADSPVTRDSVVVEKVHINIWQLSFHNIYMDIGVHFILNKKTAIKDKSINFKLYTPFLVDNETLKDLSSELRDKNVAQLIFNDEVDNYKHLNRIPHHNSATVINFLGRDPFLLLESKLEKINDDKIQIVLCLDDIKLNELEDSFDCYFRFRYKVNSTSPNICLSHDGGFSDKLYFDIRFNEIRLLPEKDVMNILDTYVSIKEFYIFIIQEFNCKIALYEKGLRYTRFLEKEHFQSYLSELKKYKSSFIVYYWKDIKEQEYSSLNMVVGFEKEKISFKQFQVGVLVNLFAAGILFGNNYLEETLGSFLIVSALQAVLKYVFIASFIVSFLYILKSLYYLLKYFFSKIGRLYRTFFKKRGTPSNSI